MTAKIYILKIQQGIKNKEWKYDTHGDAKIIFKFLEEKFSCNLNRDQIGRPVYLTIDTLWVGERPKNTPFSLASLQVFDENVFEELVEETEKYIRNKQ